MIIEVNYRRLFFTIILFSFSFFCFSHGTYHGKKRPLGPPPPDSNFEMNEPFLLKGIRTGERMNNTIMIDFRFNRTINPVSILPNSIFIDRKPVNPETIHFSKDGKGFRVLANNSLDSFSIEIISIESNQKEELPLIIIEDAQEQSFYNFRSRKWQKYSSSKTI